MHAAMASHSAHADLFLQRDLTKCERRRLKLEKRGKKQQLKDNYLLEKGCNFHNFCNAVRKHNTESKLIPCGVNVKPLL